jgi:glutathione S-transferase
MITISAMKWAPPFAAGQVRDFRIRWVLKEVGWPYEVRLVDAPTLRSAEYREKQPFGQVPYFEEDGRPALFETGAIVIDVATRAGRLLPTEDGDRALAISWVIAALNSVEPFVMNLAEVEYFIEDEAAKAARRPPVRKSLGRRLGQLQTAIAGRRYLLGEEFTIADLMMASVLGIVERLDALDGHAALGDYLGRCFDRPAYREAVAEQRATIAAHEMGDMGYGRTGATG